MEEPDREFRSFGGAESVGEVVGGLVLVELAGGDVPGLCSSSSRGADAESVCDAFGGVSVELASADAAVVDESVVDVAELSLHGGASPVEALCLGKALFEIADPDVDRRDLAGLLVDRRGELFDGPLGVGDGVLVATPSEGSVVFGEGVVGLLESVA